MYKPKVWKDVKYKNVIRSRIYFWFDTWILEDPMAERIYYRLYHILNKKFFIHISDSKKWQ